MNIVDHRYMSRALQLAARGLYTAHPNPRVGCVIVCDGHIVGEGWHERAGEAHAEIHALQQAGELARGATVYITLEPCCHTGRTPPCTDALIKAGVARVVCAMPDPNPLVAGKGLQQLLQAGIRVESGVLQPQAEALNPGFSMRMLHKRPWVRCKLAMSLDGRSALANGKSQWISGAEARADVQRLRARSGAIMTGIGTVLMDDPALTVRAERLDDTEDAPPLRAEQPLRVVLDSGLRIPETARMFGLPGHTLVACVSTDACKKEKLTQKGVSVVVLPGQGQGIDLHGLMDYLAAQYQINEVLLEAGPTLSGAMLQAGLIDEWVIYVAPLLLGDSARGLFHLLPVPQDMQQRIELEITDVRAVGHDWRISGRLKEGRHH